jgi:hypothetical protein
VYPTPSPPSSSCRCSFASVPRGRPGGRSLIPSPFATYVSGDKRLNVGLENKASQVDHSCDSKGKWFKGEVANTVR